MRQSENIAVEDPSGNGESSLLKRNHKDAKAVRLPMESGNVFAVYV